MKGWETDHKMYREGLSVCCKSESMLNRAIFNLYLARRVKGPEG